MSAPQARGIRIVYGSSTLGDSATDLDGPYVLEIDADGGHFEQGFIQDASASDSAFSTALSTLESGFTDPRQRLRIIQDVDGSDVTLFDFDPAAGSGFHQAARLFKPGDPDVDGENAYRWTFRVDFILPADDYDNAGRRDSTVNLSTDESGIRRIVISGEYRADTSDTSSSSQYRDAISAYQTAVIAAFATGGVFEEETSFENIDDIDAVMTFETVQQEILINQSISTKDHATLKKQTLLVAKRTLAPGDAPGNVGRLEEADVRYFIHVDKTVSTDLAGTYASISRPWMLSYFQSIFSGQIAITDERPEYDGVKNTISATMTILIDPGNDLLALTVQTRINDSTGARLQGTWNGRRLGKYRFFGTGACTRTVTETQTFRGTGVAECTESGVSIPGPGSQAQAAGAGSKERKEVPPSPAGDAGGGGGLQSQLMMTVVDFATRQIGTDEHGFDVTDLTVVTIEEFFENIDTPTPFGPILSLNDPEAFADWDNNIPEDSPLEIATEIRPLNLGGP